jgi:hypothetical protein
LHFGLRETGMAYGHIVAFEGSLTWPVMVPVEVVCAHTGMAARHSRHTSNLDTHEVRQNPIRLEFI